MHIEIYPHNNASSAQASLWALRAKGYHPQVVVTYMRVDYSRLIHQVFPHAVHHECIFHALQQVREHIQEGYGTNCSRTCPEVVALKREIDQIFKPVPSGLPFEKVHRFTPFSNDAQPRIRGKCPLELAGYPVAQLPMAQLCRAWALRWPNSAFKELVPNV